MSDSYAHSPNPNEPSHHANANANANANSNSNNDLLLLSNNLHNIPPRPQIPPGHASPVRTPHPHDVLSGRGGRINSHPGNVRFREMVDSYKREYLDPRTKKVEKARIAARIVSIIRVLEPTGRFLKEDPHTGLWVEIGDERAWKKAGQALRESAPEIRAERQAQLQMLAANAQGVNVNVGVNVNDPVSLAVGGVVVLGSGSGGSIGGDMISDRVGGGGSIMADRVGGGGGGMSSGMSASGGGMSSGMSAGGGMGGAGVGKPSSSGGGGGGSSGGRKSRAADPPGPRHRPNPPEREGLARSTSRNTGSPYDNNNNDNNLPQQIQRNTSSRSGSSGGQSQSQSQSQQHQTQQMVEEDRELARMRQEYLQMQRLQQEQQRRMQQYQAQLAGRGMVGSMGSGGGGSGGGGMGSSASAGSGGSYGQDVYDEYQQMQQGLLGTYRQQVHQSAQAQLAADREVAAAAAAAQQQQQMGRGGSSSRGDDHNQRYGGNSHNSHNTHNTQNHQDIAASIMNEGLLPVESGFDIPALRGDHSPGYGQQQQYQQGQHHQQQQQEYGGGGQGGGNNNNNYQENFHQSGPIQAGEAFDRHFNSCDKTVSTMSSFDIQSMDMSSLGGFSWNQSNYNMSGLISTGSTQMSSNRNFNASSGGRSKKSTKSSKSALERKLEKINRQQVAERQQMMDQRQQQQAQQGMGHGGSGSGGMMQAQSQGQSTMQGGAHVMVKTAQGAPKPNHHSSSQERKSSSSSRNNNSKYQDSGNNSNTNNNNSNHNMSSHHNMSSLHSFGFEAIEEDELTEASYKMSNLGLSEMDMTFGSDVLSVRSKSVPKMRASEDGEKNKKKKGEEGSNNRRASTDDGHGPAKRSNSTGHVDGDAAAEGTGAKEEGVTASSVFNRSSLSSTSNSSKQQHKLGASNFSMEDFNESFKSMEMGESHSQSHNSHGHSHSSHGHSQQQSQPPQQQQQRQQRDPDGAVGGTYKSGSVKSRKKDPSGGRLPSHSSRASHHAAHGGASATSGNARAPTGRRESVGSLSMGLSDPDILNPNNKGNLDFGVSLESLRSFQSHDDTNNNENNNNNNKDNKNDDNFNDSDASSWLNQYNSMENIGSDKNPWDDEDQAQASDGTSMSEISAPRMVTAAGGGE